MSPIQSSGSPEMLSHDRVNLFNERLAVWSALSPVQGQRSEPKRTAWHRFLDDLSWLCDTELGGKSTVSIAVEEKSDRLMFWVAANGKHIRALEQLIWLLPKLRDLHDNSTLSQSSVVNEIVERTAVISCRKIRNYHKHLRRNIEEAETSESPSSQCAWTIFSFVYSLECICILTCLEATRSSSNFAQDLSKLIHILCSVPMRMSSGQRRATRH